MTKIWAQTYRHGMSSRAMDDQSAANYYDSMAHEPRNTQVEISYVHFKHVAAFTAPLEIVDGGDTL